MDSLSGNPFLESTNEAFQLLSRHFIFPPTMGGGSNDPTMKSPLPTSPCSRDAKLLELQSKLGTATNLLSVTRLLNKQFSPEIKFFAMPDGKFS